MPGSYPDPHLFADAALDALERAYEDCPEAGNGSLILSAMEAIKCLKEEMKRMGYVEHGFDPYEINESNSAI